MELQKSPVRNFNPDHFARKIKKPGSWQREQHRYRNSVVEEWREMP